MRGRERKRIDGLVEENGAEAQTNNVQQIGEEVRQCVRNLKTREEREKQKEGRQKQRKEEKERERDVKVVNQMGARRSTRNHTWLGFSKDRSHSDLQQQQRKKEKTLSKELSVFGEADVALSSLTKDRRAVSAQAREQEAETNGE